MISITSLTEIPEHTEKLKGVIFDLDDTLYSEKEYVRSGFRAVAELLPEVENGHEKLWHAFERGQSAIDTVLSEAGILTEERKERCLRAYRFHQPDIHLYPGAAELLTKLRNRGCRLGIITDGRPEGQWAKIHALGLETVVDHIIVTDELGGPKYRKPCETAFLHMASVLQTDPKELCYVGDNLKKDFIAPQKLGMRPIHLVNPDGLYYGG